MADLFPAGDFVTYLTAIIGPLTAMMIAVIIVRDEGFKRAPMWCRLFLAFWAVGMLVQGIRSWVSLVTGISPRDSELPWWVFKDLGILVFVYYWFRLKKSWDSV